MMIEMEINIVWIIAVVILVLGAVKGFKKGLVEGMIRITTYILGIIVLVILAKGIGSFIQGSVLNVLMALILLAMIRIVHRILKLLLDSCRLVSRLPVMKWLDRLGGTIFGIAQALCFIWAVFILFGYFNFGHLNSWLLEMVNKSNMLSMIYHTNYLIRLLKLV